MHKYSRGEERGREERKGEMKGEEGVQMRNANIESKIIDDLKYWA